MRDGHLYPSDAPGWGVDLDEAAAAQYPPMKFLHERWAAGVRRPDGGAGGAVSASWCARARRTW